MSRPRQASGRERVEGPLPPARPGFPTIWRNHGRAAWDLKRYLSHGDAVACLELTHLSLGCANDRDLSELVVALGALIGADYSASLLNTPASSESAGRIRIVGGTFPQAWLAVYGQRQYHRVDPIVAENFTSFSLQYWADTYRRRPPPREFVLLAEDFGLRNGFTYGVQEGGCGGGSLFSFSGPDLRPTSRNRLIQDLVLPHLHRALCQVGEAAARPEPGEPLSPRELEVLKWTGAGKSSWETGMILHISERTVNFHMKNIVRKLDAVNRTQAVAMALRQGLLQLS
jgi:DNA-binding CsgD family transcriptional regulator